MIQKDKKVSQRLFAHIWKYARTYHTPFFLLKKGKEFSDTTRVQYAVVIPKKCVAHAVKRNTLKRRLYAALRDIEREQAVSPGIYIIIAKKPTVGASFSELKQELTKLVVEDHEK